MKNPADEIVILSAVRTPIGKFGGSLLPFSAADLGGVAAREAIRRAGINPADIHETIFGHARQAGGGPNTARQVARKAAVPDSATAFTVNMACASGMKSIALAAQALWRNDAAFALAGGTESMSNTPYLLTTARWGSKLGHAEVVDAMYKDGFHCPLAEELMGATAETLADQYKISRHAQDEYAVLSQQRAGAAVAAGRFRDEIIPIEIKNKKGAVQFASDEHVRTDVTLEGMAKLPPVFRANGSVHAGNSSGITDGAAALVLTTASTAKQRGLKPLVRLVEYTVAGVDPKIMGIGPVPAVRKLLEKTGLALPEIDLIELNEAFAAQVIACERDLQLDRARMNVNGGAIALGHPIGVTGARISVTLLHEMKKRGARFGLATLCVSGGMGMAVLYENLT